MVDSFRIDLREMVSTKEARYKEGIVSVPNTRDRGSLRSRRKRAILQEVVESYGSSNELLVPQSLIEGEEIGRIRREEEEEDEEGETNALVERVSKESEILPERIGKSIGHICPEVTVVYENVSARGVAVQSKDVLPSPIGVTKSVLRLCAHAFLRKKKEKEVSVLENISGVLLPVCLYFLCEPRVGLLTVLIC